MDYNYPLKEDWSTVEIIAVASFYEAIEKAYESGVTGEKMLAAYRGFKKVVPSMSEEKTLFKEFEEASGYNSYRVIQSAKAAKEKEVVKGMPTR